MWSNKGHWTQRSCHQLPISEVSSIENPAQGVPEDMRVIAIVKTPLQFF